MPPYLPGYMPPQTFFGSPAAAAAHGMSLDPMHGHLPGANSQSAPSQSITGAGGSENAGLTRPPLPPLMNSQPGHFVTPLSAGPQSPYPQGSNGAPGIFEKAKEKHSFNGVSPGELTSAESSSVANDPDEKLSPQHSESKAKGKFQYSNSAAPEETSSAANQQAFQGHLPSVKLHSCTNLPLPNHRSGPIINPPPHQPVPAALNTAFWKAKPDLNAPENASRVSTSPQSMSRRSSAVGLEHTRSIKKATTTSVKRATPPGSAAKLQSLSHPVSPLPFHNSVHPHCCSYPSLANAQAPSPSSSFDSMKAWAPVPNNGASAPDGASCCGAEAPLGSTNSISSSGSGSISSASSGLGPVPAPGATNGGSSNGGSGPDWQPAFTQEFKRRTKTGCLTCRRRRVKCDEQRPQCRNCMKSERVCLGYDTLFSRVRIQQIEDLSRRRRAYRNSWKMRISSLLGTSSSGDASSSDSPPPYGLGSQIRIRTWLQLVETFRGRLSEDLDNLLGTQNITATAQRMCDSLMSNETAVIKVAGELEAMRQMIMIVYPAVEAAEVSVLDSNLPLEKLKTSDEYYLMRAFVEAFSPDFNTTPLFPTSALGWQEAEHPQRMHKSMERLNMLGKLLHLAHRSRLASLPSDGLLQGARSILQATSNDNALVGGGGEELVDAIWDLIVVAVDGSGTPNEASGTAAQPNAPFKTETPAYAAASSYTYGPLSQTGVNPNVPSGITPATQGDGEIAGDGYSQIPPKTDAPQAAGSQGYTLSESLAASILDPESKPSSNNFAAFADDDIRRTCQQVIFEMKKKALAGDVRGVLALLGLSAGGSETSRKVLASLKEIKGLSLALVEIAMLPRPA